MSNVNQVGKYQLVAEIARGGMGIVYLAVATGRAGFSKLLVLKELKPELAEEPAYLEMFFEEARLAARLSHPNISQIYEVDSDEGRHFIVMDYLDGRALSRVLRRRDPQFTLAMALRVLCEVLQGLEYAHTLADYDGTPIGIVHRDVTPQNVFITFDGQVKLVDFGIAKSNDSRIETRAGTLKGKPAYMSPEQVTGTVDLRADIFAVGAMLFEAVAGRRVWANRPDVEILTGLIKGEIPALAEVAPSAAPELLRVCAKAMAVSPAGRYQSAAEMRVDLERFLASSEGGAVSAREVGQRVATMFETERLQTRAAIETHVATATAGALGPSLPKLIAGRMEGTPSGAGSNSNKLRYSSAPSLRTPEGSAMPPAPVEATAPMAQNKRAGFLALALGGFALLAGIVLLASVGRSKGELPVNATILPRPEAPASTASVSVSAPAPAPPASSVAIAPMPDAGATQEPPKPGYGGDRGGQSLGRGRPSHVEPVAAPPPPPPPSVPAPPPAAKPDCDPPFYFNGTKKVFKPGCL